MANTKKMGLLACVGLVVANMMGSGIALLPAQLAAYGGITIISWGITLLGAMALAFVFAELGAEDEIVGGPAAYAKEVAPVFGFQAGIIYYMANWIGNIAICLTGMSYLAVFFPVLNHSFYGTIASICMIWLLTFLNLLGGKWISKVATIGVACMLVPIIITAIGGWLWFDSSVYASNWHVAKDTGSGMSVLQGILICLWAFIGVESASVSSGNVDNPKKTVPRATMIGVAFAGLVYVASSQVMLGMFSASELSGSSAPFAMSTGEMIGPWFKPIVSLVTMITCFTSLSSWMMMVSQSAMESAESGDFPKLYKEVNKKGVPVKGLLLTSCLMSAVLLFFGVLGSGGRGMNDIFKDVINIAVLLTMIPYVYSSMNLLRFDKQKGKGAFILMVALIAAAFCLLAIIGGGAVSIAGTFIVSLVVLVFYARKEGIEQHLQEQQQQKNQNNIQE